MIELACQNVPSSSKSPRQPCLPTFVYRVQYKLLAARNVETVNELLPALDGKCRIEALSVVNTRSTCMHHLFLCSPIKHGWTRNHNIVELMSYLRIAESQFRGYEALINSV
jgi:hypothetical protein